MMINPVLKGRQSYKNLQNNKTRMKNSVMKHRHGACLTAVRAGRHGAWGMGHGAWGMGHGAWGMGHGAWSMEHGAWRLEHGAWGLVAECFSK